MSTSRNLAVGLFVTAAVALLIAFTLWITGQRGSEPRTSYAVLIDKDVSGLMLGGPVFFMGVQVGEVTDVSILAGSPHQIRVEVSILKNTPIDSGSRATLALQGITGVSVVNLTSSKGEHQPLVNQGQDPLPLIPYEDTGFSALFSNAQEVMGELSALLGKANLLLSDSNLMAVNSALYNIEQLTAQLTADESALAQVPESINLALVEIRATVAQLQTMMSNAEPNIESALNNIAASSSNLAGITQRLDQLLENQDEALNQFSSDGLGQVPDLLRETRGAVRALELLLQDLRDNPSSAIYRPAESAIVVEE